MPKSRKRKPSHPSGPPSPPIWMEDDGSVHAILPGEDPSPEELEDLARRYQDKIRHSPIWDRMVQEFGPLEAERILLKFKVEIRP